MTEGYKATIDPFNCVDCGQLVYVPMNTDRPILLFPIPGGPDPETCLLDLYSKPTRHRHPEEVVACDESS